VQTAVLDLMMAVDRALAADLLHHQVMASVQPPVASAFPQVESSWSDTVTAKHTVSVLTVILLSGSAMMTQLPLAQAQAAVGRRAVHIS
jgi:hypothetical protein